MYKPFLPPYDEVDKYFKNIYQNQIVTNNGPLVQELENQLKAILGVKHLLVVGNATIGLQMAIGALELDASEILTSAFSYVAAPSAIFANNCKSKFVDINKDDYCINSELIEQKITSKTKAILPTHIFNTVCDVEKIQTIADKYSLNVIYDAAHSFGVEYKKKSIFNFGDISVCSMHAYKCFNMIEGGFITTSDDHLAEKLYEIRYFGANRNNNGFNRIGYNGKNSEFHAAVGLANIKYIDEIRTKRKQLFELYQQLLKEVPVTWQKMEDDVKTNFAYLPLVFNDEKTVLKVLEVFNKKGIGCKRYFYPSLNENDFFGDFNTMKNSESISRRILCFPLYYDLTEEEVKIICKEIITIV